MSMVRRSRNLFRQLHERLGDVWRSATTAEVAKGDCNRVIDDWVAERLFDRSSSGSLGVRMHGILDKAIRDLRRLGDFMEGGVPSNIASARQNAILERLAMWQQIARRFP